MSLMLMIKHIKSFILISAKRPNYMKIILISIFSTVSLFYSLNDVWSVDFGKGLEAYKNQNFPSALREWKPLAKKGVAQAQSNLGVMYSQGTGVPKDYKMALRWWKKAANQGHIQAYFNLGVMFHKGNGVEFDIERAIKWYTLAAKQGMAKAQFNLAFIYDKGSDTFRDTKEAFKWYKLAAKNKDARSMTNLGVLYALGRGVPENYIQAYKWGNLGGANGNKNGAELRNLMEEKLTITEIAKAQALGRKCVKKDYIDC